MLREPANPAQSQRLEEWIRIEELVKQKLLEAECNNALRMSTIEDLEKYLRDGPDQTSLKQLPSFIERLNPVLDRMQSFANAITAVSQYSPVACLIWGGIQAIIENACAASRGLEETSDVITDLGWILPQFESYMALFPGSFELQWVMQDIFQVFLDYCVEISKHFRRGYLKSYFFPFFFDATTPQKIRQKLSSHVEKFRELVSLAHREQVIQRDLEVRRLLGSELTVLPQATQPTTTMTQVDFPTTTETKSRDPIFTGQKNQLDSIETIFEGSRADQESRLDIVKDTKELLLNTQNTFQKENVAEIFEPSSNGLVSDGGVPATSIDESTKLHQWNEPKKKEIFDGSASLSKPLPPSRTEVPPTDSGYASLKNKAAYGDTLSIRSDNEVLDIEVDSISNLSSVLADEIIHRTGDISNKSQQSIDGLLFYLPELLRELSMDLKHLARSKSEKNAAVFIRHHRRLITRYLKDHIDCSRQHDPDEGSAREPFLTDSTPSFMEKVDGWALSAPGRADEGSENEEKASENEDDPYEEAERIPHQYTQSWNFIMDSSGFYRFVMKIDSLANLTSRENTTVQFLHQEVMSVMNKHSTADVDPKDLLKHAVLNIDWNPAQFMQQSSLSGRTRPIHEYLTLTGTPLEVQAATVGEYMAQVWPITGIKTLDALQSALEIRASKENEPLSFSVHYKFSEHTSVKIVQLAPQVQLEILGLDYDVAELSEQFSWLGAACRFSPFEHQGCISAVTMKTEKTIDTLLIIITFRAIRLNLSDTAINSLDMPICWYQMFKDPVVVTGFPTRARANGENGMEVSMEVMVDLADTDHATIFDGGLLLKGFSTMLVPIRQTSRSIQWHFICDLTGNRLSYWEANKINPNRQALSNLDFGVLKIARHFVGWTSAAVLNTGGADVDYESIGYTGSNFSKPGCALEKVQIFGSHYLGGSMTFGKWTKNAPAYLTSSSFYDRKVHFARKIYVILYDTHDRRAWLVDGASALLHLCMAKLHSRRISSSELLQLETFDYPVLKSGPDTAMNALLKLTNRTLPIFEEWDEKSIIVTIGDNSREEIRRKKTVWTFQNLVEESWGSLEEIYEHQVKQLQTPGIGLRGTTRDKLEGFGFKDIVESNNPIRPRVAMLKSSGRGWVDLTKKLHAITLMGTGFGQLIQPAQGSSALCSDWKSVPKHRDYLATCTWLLQEICDVGGNQYSKPLELYDGIYWHKGTKLFEPCADCRRCDRVQVLLPPSLGHGMHPRPFSNASGGIVFGRSSQYRWKWPLVGKPVVSDRVEGDLSTDDEADDSGLGTSI